MTTTKKEHDFKSVDSVDTENHSKNKQNLCVYLLLNFDQKSY